MAVLIQGGTTVNSKDAQFFKALGARIAQARKDQNVTQQNFVMNMLDAVIASQVRH